MVFWIVLCVGLSLVSGLVFYENPTAATIVFFIFFAVISWWFEVPVLSAMLSNPIIAATALLVYVATGVLWSFARWGIHLNRTKQRYNADVKTWLEKQGVAGDRVPVEHRDGWGRSVYANRWRGKIPPNVADHKHLIVLWIMYWPLSLFWTALDEPIRYLTTTLYERVRHGYTRMAAAMFKDVQDIPGFDERDGWK